MRDILAWVVAVELLGFAALPLLRVFFDDRRDAALLARPLGLALAAYVAWALAVLGLPFDRLGILVAVGLVAAVGWRLHRRAGKPVPIAIWVAVAAYCLSLTRVGEGAPGRFLLIVTLGGLWSTLGSRPEEKRAAILFWAAAGVFLVIRAAWPEILGQEKFMDLAFVNSLTRNTNMPPVDPWMAGRTISYYYWGYLLVAAATKLANIPTLLSYNLALATFAGYSFLAAACLGLRLSKGRLAAGIAAAAATVFAGNLTGAVDGWNYFLGHGFDYFHASRVIGLDPTTHDYTTISEFPFFTFFQADLHPHLLAFPYFVAAFAVGHRFLVSEPPGANGGAAGVRSLLSWWRPAILLVLTAGTSIAANLWTLPAIAILIAAICVFRGTGGRQLPRLWDAILGIGAAAVLTYVAYALWLPYEASFSLTGQHPEQHGIARNTLTSGLLEFLGVWGILFAVGLCAFWPRDRGADEPRLREHDLGLAAAAAVSLFVAVGTKAPALAIVFFLILLAARSCWEAWRRTHDSEDAFSSFLLLLGLAMVAGCEFVHFRDSYGDRLQRMNTIFKFYNQAWPLIAVSVAVWAERRWREAVGPRRRALAVLLGASALAALSYPAAATIQRLRQHEGPVTLDAREALHRRNPADADAIAWLARNVHGGAVLIEASGGAYSEYARMSTHTGIPTVMGWANHEGLWRENDPEVAERDGLVRVFYTTRDERLALKIAQRFHVSHVVLGEMESRTYANADDVATFSFLEPAFPGATSVFRVATPAPAAQTPPTTPP